MTAALSMISYPGKTLDHISGRKLELPISCVLPTTNGMEKVIHDSVEGQAPFPKNKQYFQKSH